MVKKSNHITNIGVLNLTSTYSDDYIILDGIKLLAFEYRLYFESSYPMISEHSCLLIGKWKVPIIEGAYHQLEISNKIICNVDYLDISMCEFSSDKIEDILEVRKLKWLKISKHIKGIEEFLRGRDIKVILV